MMAYFVKLANVAEKIKEIENEVRKIAREEGTKPDRVLEHLMDVVDETKAITLVSVCRKYQ